MTAKDMYNHIYRGTFLATAPIKPSFNKYYEKTEEEKQAIIKEIIDIAERNEPLPED